MTVAGRENAMIVRRLHAPRAELTRNLGQPEESVHAAQTTHVEADYRQLLL